jgi:hypothetical protein
MRQARAVFSTVLVVGLVAGGYSLGRVMAGGAPTMQPLFYAGTLEEGGTLPTGPRTITLALHDAPEAGRQLCTSSTEKVPVEVGRFRLELSPECVAALAATPDAWMALSFKDASGIPHDLPGRTKVGAVPYALEANHALAANQASAAAGALQQTLARVEARLSSLESGLTARPVIASAGPLPLSAEVTASGGPAVLLVSGSAFGASAIGLLHVYVDIDGVEREVLSLYTNEPDSHKTFPSEVIPLSLTAGKHTIRFRAHASAATDYNDFFQATLIELRRPPPP